MDDVCVCVYFGASVCSHVFISFGWTPKSEVAGSNGEGLFPFLRGYFLNHRYTVGASCAPQVLPGTWHCHRHRGLSAACCAAAFFCFVLFCFASFVLCLLVFDFEIT